MKTKRTLCTPYLILGLAIVVAAGDRQTLNAAQESGESDSRMVASSIDTRGRLLGEINTILHPEAEARLPEGLRNPFELAKLPLPPPPPPPSIPPPTPDEILSKAVEDLMATGSIVMEGAGKEILLTALGPKRIGNTLSVAFQPRTYAVQVADITRDGYSPQHGESVLIERFTKAMPNPDSWVNPPESDWYENIE